MILFAVLMAGSHAAVDEFLRNGRRPQTLRAKYKQVATVIDSLDDTRSLRWLCALVMGDGALCYGALEIVGLLLLLLLLLCTDNKGYFLDNSPSRKACSVSHFFAKTDVTVLSYSHYRFVLIIFGGQTVAQLQSSIH